MPDVARRCMGVRQSSKVSWSLHRCIPLHHCNAMRAMHALHCNAAGLGCVQSCNDAMHATPQGRLYENCCDNMAGGVGRAGMGLAPGHIAIPCLAMP
jgi:hypothetical protein